MKPSKDVAARHVKFVIADHIDGPLDQWVTGLKRDDTSERHIRTWAAGPESSGNEFGFLEDDRWIDTGVFQQRYLLHELVFARSQPPPQQPQISYSILSQADWCAVQKVARCELGLLPVVNTVNAGARVFR